MVGDVAGTIAYMPPEQVRDFKEVRPPSDIYAVFPSKSHLSAKTRVVVDFLAEAFEAKRAGKDRW